MKSAWATHCCWRSSSQPSRNNKQRDWPEYKTCKSTTEAIITEGTEKGELRKICADANCPVHHPKKQKPTANASGKAEQEKQRREEALAQTTGLRVLNAIVAAVPVRLMKRDLLFIVERVATMLDERRLEVVARNRGIKKAKDSDSIPKLLSAYIRKADEGELGGGRLEGGRGKCQTRTIVWHADGAGPNRRRKARSARLHALGRPPERHEVDIRRAKALPRICLDLNSAWRKVQTITLQ